MRDTRKVQIPLDRIGDREALKLLAKNYARATHQLELLEASAAKLKASKEDFSAHELKTVEFWISVTEMILQNTEAQDLSASFCSDIIEKYNRRFNKIEKSWNGFVGEAVRGAIYIALYVAYELIIK